MNQNPQPPHKDDDKYERWALIFMLYIMVIATIADPKRAEALDSYLSPLFWAISAYYLINKFDKK
ncbi:MAG: hypothetical protein ACPGWR_28965 [Ardenticatenaceae bacterium]